MIKTVKQNKQPLSPKKADELLQSMQKQFIFARLIQIEFTEVQIDSRLKVPQVNMFSKRIEKDALQIIEHLKTNERVNLKCKDMDFIDNRAGELHRIINYFMFRPVEFLKDFADQLAENLKKENDETPPGSDI